MYNEKGKWSGIEVVITSYTGTVVVASSGPWVRIPLTPPNKMKITDSLGESVIFIS